MKASIFYRIADILLLLFAVGHALGFRQNNSEWGASSVIALMQSVHLNAMGFKRTYWDFFSAFGFSCTVFLLFAAVLTQQLGSRCRTSNSSPDEGPDLQSSYWNEPFRLMTYQELARHASCRGEPFTLANRDKAGGVVFSASFSIG